jgi:hypothetical protein
MSQKILDGVNKIKLSDNSQQASADIMFWFELAFDYD